MEEKEHSAIRSLWLVAVAAIVVYWLTVLVTGFLATPAYSQMDLALSTLGLADAPYGIIARSAFVVLGLGILFLAAHFRKIAAPLDRLGLAVVVLLVVHGVGRIGEGLFPPVEGSAAGTLHLVFGVPAVLAMPVLPFVFAAWSRASRRGGLARWSLVFGVVFAVLMFLGVVMMLFPLGLGQRVGFAGWYIWLIWAFSVQALQLSESEQADTESAPQ